MSRDSGDNSGVKTIMNFSTMLVNVLLLLLLLMMMMIFQRLTGSVLQATSTFDDRVICIFHGTSGTIHTSSTVTCTNISTCTNLR